MFFSLEIGTVVNCGTIYFTLWINRQIEICNLFDMLASISSSYISIHEGHSINNTTKVLFIETTCAIFMNDTSLKRFNSCRYNDILHNDNHIFLRCAKKTTTIRSYRQWPYLLLKLIIFSYGLA